jgi:AcrR family transcriptional regulator
MTREEQREQLVAASLRVVAEHGPAELTVRRIAEAAGMSTMAVYSGFGGRAGVLEALYQRAFDMLGQALRAVAAVPSVADYLLDVACAYRAFALAGPSRYAFMFSGAVPDFTPSEELRTSVLEAMSTPLLGPVGGDLRKAYVLWGTMHGLVGLELAGVLATPPPSWGVVPDEGAAERMYRAGVQAVLAGLAV